MTIAFHNGSNSGLFDKVGAIGGGVLDALALMGGVATARVLAGGSWATRESNLYGYYNTAPLSPATIDGLDGVVSGWRGSQSSFLTQLAAKAGQTVQDMANADTALAQKTLANAMALVVSQMKGAGQTVQASAPSVGAQTPSGTPAGNPVLAASVKNGKGLLLEYMLAEILTLAVSQDSQGGAAAGNEQLTVTGQAAAPSMLDYRWPLGSGVNNVFLQLADGSKSNAAGNLFVNPEWLTTTTPNLGDNWTAAAGAPGIELFTASGANAYETGGGSVQFTGTATAPSVTQQFNKASSTVAGAGGSPAVLTPDTVYCYNVWIKCSATPAAGVARFALIDGAGAVINDDQAAANLATRTLTSIGTSFVNFNTFFRTPAVLPATVKFRLDLSTGIDSGKSVYFGRQCFAKAQQLYAPAGPFLAGFSGNANAYAGDAWTMTAANAMGVVQSLFLRLFNMPSLGLILPSAASSPTIPESVVA